MVYKREDIIWYSLKKFNPVRYLRKYVLVTYKNSTGPFMPLKASIMTHLRSKEHV